MYKYEKLPFKLIGYKNFLALTLFSFGCLQSVTFAATLQVGVSANCLVPDYGGKGFE